MNTAKKYKKEDSNIQIVQVNSYLGAEVRGLDLSKKLNKQEIEIIESQLAKYSVLVFRDQPMTGDQLMQFGKNFGQLSVHPFSPNDKKNPALILFKNDKTTPPWKTDVWHSDETFRKIPPFATMLHALDVPKFGGDTMFVSMTAAYEGLSDRMQHYLSGLEAYHDFIVFKDVFGKTPNGRKKLREYERDYPPTLHPVIAEHPITGKKLVFVNLAVLLDCLRRPERHPGEHGPGDVHWHPHRPAEVRRGVYRRDSIAFIHSAFLSIFSSLFSSLITRFPRSPLYGHPLLFYFSFFPFLLLFFSPPFPFLFLPLL